MADEPTQPTIQFSRRIDAGHILQAAVMAAGAIVFLVVGNEKGNNTASQLRDFRTDMVTQMQGLQKDVQQQNTQIPVMQNQIAAIARDIIRIEDHSAQQDQSIGGLTAKTEVLRSDVDGLKQASSGSEKSNASRR